MLIFCTLFNSGYLDKGLLMYESLTNVIKEFRLYIVAFDQSCYDILSDIKSENLIPISLNEFETPTLLEAKKNRTNQEYCWTCSCHTIKHILEHYQEEHCTYIDADMYFYQSPECLLQEMKEYDVGIMEHGMLRGTENARAIKLSGKYCIEFNTFKATPNGMKILNWWCDRCLERCTATPDGIYFGDQKYLDDWLIRFQGVHVYKNPGAGVAPWNIAKYRLGRINKNNIRLRFHREEFPLIFYHFQAICYLSKNIVDVRVHMYPNKSQKILCDILYSDYLARINVKRDMLFSHYAINLDNYGEYGKKFSKRQFFIEDLLGERNIYVFITKIWRIFIRKNKDYYIIE